MRIAYLDCFAGISGDMFLGALLGAGVPVRVLEEAVAALDLGASLRIEIVDRSGISATKVDVLDKDRVAEGVHSGHSHRHAAGHSLTHSHGDESSHSHSHSEAHGHAHDAVTEHSHSHSHSYEHEPKHGHGDGRSLSVICGMIEAAPLGAAVKRLAIRAFELLGAAESKIHNLPIEQIHFHEVGAVDAIVDIVAASAGIIYLDETGPNGRGPVRWHCSPVNVGGGMVKCSHGTFPVPAPATADLLRDCPTYSAHLEKELATPTGAALLRAMGPIFGSQPAMRVQGIGYGAGTRNPKGFPNVLRLSVGESAELQPESTDFASESTQTVMVLETAIDDLNPQVLAYVAERLLQVGALDVMLTPVIMKKGRPGTLLTVLANPDKAEELEVLLLRETSTLGIRIRREERACMDRAHVAVSTLFGEIRVKVGLLGGVVLNAMPEFEDCRAAAAAHGAPLKQVMQAAMAVYAAGAAK